MSIRGTTPANPIERIAPISAYDWREDIEHIRDCVDIVIAYIEHLEAKRDAAESERIEAVKRYERAEEVSAALLAEHEAVGEGYGDETADAGCDCLSCRIIRAHDNAERVIRGE